MGVRFPGSWVVLAILAAWTAFAMLVFVLSDDAGAESSQDGGEGSVSPATEVTRPPSQYEPMSLYDAGGLVLVENTNSGAIENDQISPTTSYIAGYYAVPEEGVWRKMREGSRG